MGVLRFIVYKTLLLQALQLLRTDAQCLNATEVAVKQLGLNDKPYWKAKVHDFEHCAKVCVRRKPCLSITYDSQTRLCEMHTGTRENTFTKRGTYLMYSEFQWWPPSVDDYCYSRPCKDNEVCIPGSIAGGASKCSYTCMVTGRDVCPMPVFGVSAGRTVGSVNVHRCGKGLTGGGSATCLSNKTWDKNISCISIHQSPCTDDTLCSKIKARCLNDICECTGQYDAKLKECRSLRLNNGSNPVIPTRQYSGYLEMFFDGTWKAVTYESWTWQATKVACKTLFGFRYGGTYHTKWFDTSNRNRLSDAIELDQLSCTGEEEALELCTEVKKNADINKQVALTCFDYDFTKNVIINETAGQDMGILLVKIEGEFGAICKQGWNNRNTEVACRSINATLDCRNLEKYDVSWSGMIQTAKVRCTGNEPHLFYCENRGWRYSGGCDDNKVVGLKPKTENKK